MMFRNTSQKLVFALLVTFALSAFATDPANLHLNCPAGTKQVSTARGKVSDMVACIKADEAKFVPHGTIVMLYPDGTKSAEGPAENGFRTGLWTFYDKQGQKTGTAMFRRGSFHGEVVELHENGKIRTVDQYVDGLREGTSKEYSADGSLVKQTEYRNNRQVSVK